MSEQEQIKAILQEKIQAIIQNVLNDQDIKKEDRVEVINSEVLKLYLELRHEVTQLPEQQSNAIEVQLPITDSPDLQINIPPGFFDI